MLGQAPAKAHGVWLTRAPKHLEGENIRADDEALESPGRVADLLQCSLRHDRPSAEYFSCIGILERKYLRKNTPWRKSLATLEFHTRSWPSIIIWEHPFKYFFELIGIFREKN
jgi:hypothetical protein